MVDPQVIDRRLERLELVLADLANLALTPTETFCTDRGAQAQAERWVQVAVESCVDLANHLIADRGLPTPSTYREAFESLAGAAVIDKELAGQMAAWAGLRNLVVHMYLDIDHGRLHRILNNDLEQLRAFAAKISLQR